MAETYAEHLPNQDERVMAALSHLAIIIPYVGLVVPVIVWISQKEKSRYVAFQALQAIAYQIVWLFAWILAMACYLGSFFFVFMGAEVINRGPTGSEAVAMIPFFLFFLFLLASLVYVIYGLAAAILTFMGRDFRYLLLGRFVERYFEQPKAEPAA